MSVILFEALQIINDDHLDLKEKYKQFRQTLVFSQSVWPSQSQFILAAGAVYAGGEFRISLINSPCTSVSRMSRPPKRKVNRV